MELKSILSNYSNRVPTISSYYFLTTAFSNRNKFKEFSNEEFFNMVMQLLLFIFNKSIKKENCFKEDLNEFIEELNLNIYKKELNEEELVELTGYIINGLRNNGKDGMLFSYYDTEKEVFDTYKISFIKDTQLNNKNGSCILSYSLTTDALKLLLSTKEYDEMYQIQVSQMMAKLRIENGDYDGAKDEIQNIVNRLNIQQQEISNYLKCVKNDIYFAKKERFIDLLNKSMTVLTQEMDNYDSLKSDVLGLIKDKEDFLNTEIGKEDDNIFKIKKELILMKELIEGITVAKNESINLMNNIQDFRIEYDDILYKMLKNGISSKFNFNEVVLNNMECSNVNIDNLHKLYNSLFLPKLNEVFYIDTPYQEQNITNSQKEENIEINDDWDKIDTERKELENKLILEHENYYYFIMETLVNYSIKYKEFTIKEFLNFFIKSNQNMYMELTKNSMLFRHLILTLVNTKSLKLKEIQNRLNKTKFTQSKEIQFERIFDRLLANLDNFESIFNSLTVLQLDEDITINTEINIAEMTSTKLTIPNILFDFSN